MSNQIYLCRSVLQIINSPQRADVVLKQKISEVNVFILTMLPIFPLAFCILVWMVVKGGL